MLFRKQNAPQRQNHVRRLKLESLERRHLFATLTWTGDAGSNFESPLNWTPQQIPQPDDTIIFDGYIPFPSRRDTDLEFAKIYLGSGVIIHDNINADTVISTNATVHGDNFGPCRNRSGLRCRRVRRSAFFYDGIRRRPKPRRTTS